MYSFLGAEVSKKKILIVDDDRTTVSVIKLYLEDYGYEITDTAFNGRDAIEMSRTVRPDLVLMDINLGKGLDGIDAAEIITKHLDIPVVFITVHADKNTLDRAKLTKPAGYINKPLRETDLKTTIEFALSKTNKQNFTDTNISIKTVLESLYNLTPAEARVAAKLIEYPELKNAADALNISISTARTHLKKIFRKTNTNKQTILVHKIVTGPVGLLINKNN